LRTKVDQTQNTRFIDHFYQHISEDDWADGVDLYQSGRIANLQIFPGLVTAKIRDTSANPLEVRIKLHPSGAFIQWIECTCKKNRVQGRFCEHIAAMAVHLDRERPDIVKRFDLRMPVKPPVSTARKNAANTMPAEGAKEGSATPQKGKTAGAVQSLINQAGEGLHSISLLAGGPMLRVRVELKAGQVSHYDLSLDEAARFLSDQPNHAKASAEVAELRVYTFAARLGLRVYSEDDETIVVEKCLAIDAERDRRLAVQLRKLKGGIAEAMQFDRNADPPEPRKVNRAFQLSPSKTLHLGQQYCFLPGIGYFPLDRAGTTPAWQETPDAQRYAGDDAAALAESAFKGLATTGTLWIDPDLMDNVVLTAPKLSEIEFFGEEDGWFNLDPKYSAGGQVVSMIDLIRELKKEKRKYIKTGKVWLKIPDLVASYNWQTSEDGNALKVNTLGLMRLKAALGGFDQFAGSKKVLNTLRSKYEFSPESKLPALKNKSLHLRPYQETGLKWLWWLRQNHLHGLLADEMGLGKTHQAMGLLNLVSQSQKTWRFLVISPTTVLDHWEDKLRVFSAELNPLKYHGPARASLAEKVKAEKTTVVTSYGVLLRDQKLLSSMKWDAVILDEAHFVKNSETATYQAACQLNTEMRVCLTGTPMENHLGELKNIFDFLLPGYLGSDDYFRRNFSQPLADGSNLEVELALQKLLHPFKMRRTKNNVLPDLPAKIEDIRHCGMSEEQVSMYKDVLALKARPLLEQLQNDQAPVPYLHVFATISLLKQICDHPALINKSGDYTKHSSGKFDLLKELVEEALGSGHKIVIFSQYLQMIEIIKKHLGSLGVGHVSLTGQSKDRGAIISKFQNDEDCKVFVGSLLAGGIGIDLTAASVVIHYDRWWNASKENQATDRVHRIGQNKNVQVLKLVTRGTLEEKIDRLIQNKRSLFEKFVDRDEEIFKNLTRQELIELLQ
jgi:superfamily II DNA or RNA helicase